MTGDRLPAGRLDRRCSGRLVRDNTTRGRGINAGTVFEIPKTGSGYGALITIASFTDFGGGAQSNGAVPAAILLADAAGDLFGTTVYGGLYNDGTVFEIAKTASGYGAPITLSDLQRRQWRQSAV